MTATVRELTARGRGGVSVLEIRGPGARERVRALVEAAPLAPGDLRVVRLASGGELLDEAILWVAEHDRLELHLHGSPPLVERVRRELGGSATESADDGTLEERAQVLLAGAPSEAAARVLLDQVEGALRREVTLLSANVAAGDVQGERQRSRDLLDAGERCRALFAPPLVVLAGPVNAGKSTLFNALLGHERVVVDPSHGTTRDAVRERVQLGEHAFDLVDTAGERATGRGPEADVERGGQELGRALRADADAVLWLVPPGEAAPTGELPAGWVVLWSRADERTGNERTGDAPASGRSISTHADPAGARTAVVEAVHAALALPRTPWVPGAPVPFEPAQLALLDELSRPPTATAPDRQGEETLARLDSLFLH